MILAFSHNNAGLKVDIHLMDVDMYGLEYILCYILVIKLHGYILHWNKKGAIALVLDTWVQSAMTG